MKRTKYLGDLEKTYVFEPSDVRSIIVKVRWIPGGDVTGIYRVVDAWHQEDVDGLEDFQYRRSKIDWDTVIEKLGSEE